MGKIWKLIKRIANAQSYEDSGLSPTDASDSYSYVASYWKYWVEDIYTAN